MKQWKKIAGLCLALALLCAQAAMAEVTITPLTAETAAALDAGNQTEGTGSAEGGVLAEADKSGGPGVLGDQLNSHGAAVTSVAQPTVQSQAAVLYDATNGRVLYEKDARSKYYPASITKLMTALLVLENTSMTDMVTFSGTATTNLEAGAVGLDVTAGDVISVQDCLYGLLLKSANEVANGLAEHVGGSISGFAGMMNARAQALGCTGTHFNNPNGLNDTNHYTTAYDMALIAAEAFKNPTLCRIASTVNYTFPATKKVSTPRTLTMGHKMVNPSDYRYYQGIVGGKTGYTSIAGNTLVTCAERNGLRLVAVVLKSRQTHYQDTKALLDYGFALASADGTGTADGSGASNGTGTAAGPGAVDGPGAAGGTGAADGTGAASVPDGTEQSSGGPGVADAGLTAGRTDGPGAAAN